MAEEQIIYTKEDGIATITLNRPETMNSVTVHMQVDKSDILNEIALDDEVRAVILTGNGRAFCAGTDLDTGVVREELVEATKSARKQKVVERPETSLPTKWDFCHIPKPTIAAVNGAAVGMGAEWTAQCDIRIASEKARFGWVFPLRGLTPDTGAGPCLLPYIVGLGNALELMYSGEIIDAEEAKRIGLVSKVVPPDELMATAMEMAIKVSRGAPMAIKGIKELTYGSLEWPYSKTFDKTSKDFLATSSSEDSKEGVKSFFEKRPPVWQGK